MGGRNKNRRQTPVSAPQNNQASLLPPPPSSRPNARAAKAFNSALPQQTNRRQNRAEHKRPLQSPHRPPLSHGPHILGAEETSINAMAQRPTVNTSGQLLQSFQQSRQLSRPHPRQRGRQQWRGRHRQPNAYYVQQQRHYDEGPHYILENSHHGQQQQENHEIHEAHQSFQTHQSYGDHSYQMQHSYHEQHAYHQYPPHHQRAYQGFHPPQTGQLVEGDDGSCYYQESHYMQQSCYAQGSNDFQGAGNGRQVQFNAEAHGEYYRTHESAAYFYSSVKENPYYQSYDGDPRLYSKASTNATADGNCFGSNYTQLPWVWQHTSVNTEKYLEKHKDGRGLVFLRLAETPLDKRKTLLDDLDIWINVGNVARHVWGEKKALDSPKTRRNENTVIIQTE